MGLCIIAGGSGAGKTEYIYRKLIELSVKEPEGRFFVVTPEQATMQAQKEIVRLHPNHGTLNIDIVSFERLAYRIFSELSLPQPEVLDDTGKNGPQKACRGKDGRAHHVFLPLKPPGIYQ